jgi:hypothetical protein
MHEQTYPLTNQLQVEIRVPAGLIDVRAEESRDTADVRIEGERREGDVDVTFDPGAGGTDRLRIERRSGRIGFGRADLRVHLVVPTGTLVDAETESAGIVARGRLGGVAFRSGSGALDVDDVDGDVAASTASGDVLVGSTAGDLVAHGASGDVRAGTVGGSLVARTASGDVVAGSVGASATVATVSGDVRIGTLGRNRTALRAVSGDIDAGVPPGAAVYLDLSSTSGEVRTELDDTDPPAEGPDLELVATSVSGDVRVRRAEAG